ncbi:MAG: vWA domain-containing protein [Nitrososphaerales archaeon]
MAIVSLLLEEPFFGTLAMSLKFKPDPSVKTESTNGKTVRYNPKFIESIPFEQVKAEICHEVMHSAKLHPYRRDNRDMKIWNIACDFVINNELQARNYKLDSTWLRDPQFNGMSEEQVYVVISTLSKEKQDNFDKQSQDHGQVDDVKQSQGNEESIQEQIQSWQNTVLRAAKQAEQVGKLPAFVKVLVEAIKNPIVDWRALLRRFLEQSVKKDYTWTRPNSRYTAAGLYLPSLQSESILPVIVVYWDTSGSRWSQQQQQQTAHEVVAIIQEAQPEETVVLFGDAKVQGVQRFSPTDIIELKPKGGGGTDFRPIFEYIEASNNDINPCCFIGITDLLGTFPGKAPDYPVLWCVKDPTSMPPFGEVLLIKER